MKLPALVLICMLLVTLAGCAPSVADSSGSPAGFWKGLWHGFTVFFTFIISLFSDSVGIYQTHNTGNLYNLGFLFGIMVFFGGSGGGACKKAR